MNARRCSVSPVRALWLVGVSLAAVLTLGASRARAVEPSGELMAEFTKDPLLFFFEQRTSEALSCGQAVLESGGQEPGVRARALTTLAAIYKATPGKEPAARAAVLEILEPDPTIDLPELDRLPPQLITYFYGIRDSLLAATGRSLPPDVRTVAFADIENNSIVKSEYDLDRFCLGLTHAMIGDLRQVSPLTIVDRRRLKTLLDEIELNRSDELMDERNRVQMGRLCGAQSFIWGSLSQISKKKIRLDLQWVETATGKYLAAQSAEAKIDSAEDLFALQKKVLVEMLAPEMEKILTGEEVKQLKRRTEDRFEQRQADFEDAGGYVDYLIQAGNALLLEEGGDYEGAEAAWQEAMRLNPQDTVARDRGTALHAYNAISEEG